MVLILQIAAGIVLGYAVIRILPRIVAGAAILLRIALAAAAIAAIVWLASAYSTGVALVILAIIRVALGPIAEAIERRTQFPVSTFWVSLGGGVMVALFIWFAADEAWRVNDGSGMHTWPSVMGIFTAALAIAGALYWNARKQWRDAIRNRLARGLFADAEAHKGVIEGEFQAAEEQPRLPTR